MLAFADWTCFAELHSIPDLTYILLIVRLELGDPTKDFFVNWVDDRSLNGHDNRFIHLVADDVAVPLTSMLLAFLHTPLLSYFPADWSA